MNDTPTGSNDGILKQIVSLGIAAAVGGVIATIGAAFTGGAIVKALGGLTTEDFKTGGKAQIHFAFVVGKMSTRAQVATSDHPDDCPSGFVDATSDGQWPKDNNGENEHPLIIVYSGDKEDYTHSIRPCYRLGPEPTSTEYR